MQSCGYYEHQAARGDCEGEGRQLAPPLPDEAPPTTLLTAA